MSRHNAVEDQAATWLVRREQPEWSSEDEEMLRGWLAESAVHQAAFWRLEAGWAAAERLSGSHLAAQPRLPAARTRAFIAFGAVAAMLLFILSASLLVRQSVWSSRVASVEASTAIGGRKDIALEDGSRVTLNTNSALHALVGKNQRQLWLDRGEAYFQIRHDSRNPFVIFAGGRKVTVLGTKFSVRRDSGKLIVAVTEGRVKVENDVGSNDSAAIVAAGNIAIVQDQSLLVTDGSAQKVEDALSWRRGMLTFDQVTLAQAAHEFNRYNVRQISFGDDRAGQIRIGGSFQANNIDAFARLLQDAFGLHVVTSDRTITINS